MFKRKFIVLVVGIQETTLQLCNLAQIFSVDIHKNVFTNVMSYRYVDLRNDARDSAPRPNRTHSSPNIR